MPISRLHRSDFGSWTRDRQTSHVFNDDHAAAHFTMPLYEAASASTRQLLHVTLHSLMDRDPDEDEDIDDDTMPRRNQAAARPALQQPPTPDIVLPHLAQAAAALTIAYAETGDVRIRRLRGSIEDVIRVRRQGT